MPPRRKSRKPLKPKRKIRRMTMQEKVDTVSPVADNGGSPMPRGRRPRPRLTVDVAWFQERLRALGHSQRSISNILGQHHTALSKKFSGKLGVNIDEVVAYSRVLQCSTDEVLFRFGYKDIEQPRVPIAGKINGDGRVSTVTAKRGSEVPVPMPPAGVKAYVVEAKDGPAASFNDALMFVGETVTGLQPNMAGRLCVVEADDQLTPILGVIGKTSARGLAPFTPFMGTETIQLHRVHSCAAVVAIRFV